MSPYYYLGIFAIALAVSIISLLAYALSTSQNTHIPKWRPNTSPTHLLVVLGSGGHTAEMFSMLRRMKLDPSKYTYRTYIVSSGDHFSAAKAVEFETLYLARTAPAPAKDATVAASYTIVTVPRARRVHQSYLTAPFSTLQSFWACLLVLRGLHPDQKPLPPQMISPYPDVVLTNGPATAVCVILAARILRLYHLLVSLVPSTTHIHTPTSVPPGSARPTVVSAKYQLRTIFVESWARVTTLSLSGMLLLPFADRFLVQWPTLGGKQAWKGMRKTEYVGAIVD
ncbi:UDP-N-acetylglucosamine transferase subunit [Aspergillus nanangensis]|uniref:UDP-N-acetylglucosamine transferase subunit ALG14 n=1 Tax=Aspergillus nanangensis TaxID=2582783 RepID=A0AAD4CAA3_ASPNN|nr:UDP-N-acetylglucosamine transferase subunit [Aspergillus nanangensis]